MEMEVDGEIGQLESRGFDYDGDDHGGSLNIEELKAMGINPFKSTKARPGSEEKVVMLSARYAAGLPLWHNEDCYDHGPHERELMGAVSEAFVAPRAPVEVADEEEE